MSRSKWRRLYRILLYQMKHYDHFSPKLQEVSCMLMYFPSDVTAQRGPVPPHSLRFLDHTQWHTTVGRTPLDESSACRRDLYLTTHNTHKRQTSLPLAGFEPAILASDRPQILALDRSATVSVMQTAIEICREMWLIEEISSCCRRAIAVLLVHAFIKRRFVSCVD